MALATRRGAAKRRRERRLRSMLRHERMTVAMALAEFSHHSSRGQRMARAGVWEHDQNLTAKVRKPPTLQPELFSLEEEPGQHLCLRSLAGRRRWSGTSWSIWPSLPPWCKSSMLLCRRWVETLHTPCGYWDFPIAEQAIEVPKISCSPCPSRSRVPEPQSAEQLVEVPTVLSPTRIALRIAEQIVDTPVPQGRGGVVKVFSQNRVQQRRLLLANAFLSGLWSRSSTFVLLLVALDRGLPHLLVLQMRILLGGFSHFSPWRKVRSAGAGGECASGWPRQLIHA